MIEEIEAKALLIKNKTPTQWFGVHHYFNIYRGCTHGCIYCDSRSECYKIEDFDNKIQVKINVLEKLRKELTRKREKGVIGFGSTSDAYIPLELKYELTKGCLEILNEFGYPVFILTKSDLVIRDLELLCSINNRNYACVCFTITTTDDALAKKIEPGAPSPSKRLEAMSILASMGIKVGINIMPTLPFITDTIENITSIVEKGKEYGASFIIPSFSVTLRDRQRDYYYEKIGDNIKNKYVSRYRNSYNCSSPNSKMLYNKFKELCLKYNIETTMPSYEKENTKVQLSLFD